MRCVTETIPHAYQKIGRGGEFGTGFRTLLKPRAIDLQVQFVGDMMNSTAQIVGAHTVYCVPLSELFHYLFTLGRI